MAPELHRLTLVGEASNPQIEALRSFLAEQGMEQQVELVIEPHEASNYDPALLENVTLPNGTTQLLVTKNSFQDFCLREKATAQGDMSTATWNALIRTVEYGSLAEEKERYGPFTSTTSHLIGFKPVEFIEIGEKIASNEIDIWGIGIKGQRRLGTYANALRSSAQPSVNN